MSKLCVFNFSFCATKATWTPFLYVYTVAVGADGGFAVIDRDLGRIGINSYMPGLSICAI